MRKVVIILSLLPVLLWAGEVQPVPLGWITFDHDTGNAILTVCSNGAIGFYDGGQVNGTGFWYPQWVTQTLFFGSMAAGNSASYVIDSYYEQNQTDDRDWKELEDSLNYHIPPEFGMEEVDCKYDDTGSTSPGSKGLECYQYSVMDASTNYDDFVIIEYIYHNGGSSAINGMYSSIFIDFDITSAATDNYGKTDASHRTAYMQNTQSNENPTVGIVYLGSEPQAQLPVANLSVIDHAIYVYPYQGLPDNIQWEFMNGNYSFSQSDRQYDWSVCVSAGPFDLAVGADQHAAFAIVGGLSNSEYLQNCQNAIDFYTANWPGVEEENQGIAKNRFWTSSVVKDRLTLNYALNNSEDVNIFLYDVNGRKIANIHKGILTGQGKINWDMTNEPSGIYFVRVERNKTVETHKLLLVK